MHTNHLQSFVDLLGKEFIVELRFEPKNGTILHHIAEVCVNFQNSPSKLIKIIVDLGVDPNTLNDNGETPLNAISTNYILRCESSYDDGLITGLAKHGCNLLLPNNIGETMLQRVIVYNIQLYKHLVARKLVSVDTDRFPKNRNSYHYIFQSYRSFKKFADIDNKLLWETDDDGMTPLMVGLLHGMNVSIIVENREFLRKAAEIPLTKDDTGTPLQYLLRQGRFQSPLNVFYMTTFPDAILKRDECAPGKPTTLHQYAKSAGPEALEEYFDHLSQFGQDAVEKMLIEKTDDGRTALVVAAEHGNYEAISTLLSRGAKIEDCAPFILTQVAYENKQYICALNLLCGGQVNETVSMETVVGSLKGFLIANEPKKDEVIVKLLQRVHAENEKSTNQLFELLCRVPTANEDKMQEDNMDTFAEQCSVFQLLCLLRKKAIVEWIFTTFDKLLNVKKSPFDVHPLDMMTERETKHENNIFHFICNDTTAVSLISEDVVESKPNQTATRTILGMLMKSEHVKKKNLLNEFNKIGDTPLHLACKANLHLVWPDMKAYGADLELKTKNGKSPVDLVTVDTAKVVFSKCVKSKAKVKEIKATPKKQTPKKRKIKQDDEDEFRMATEDDGVTLEPRRTRSRKE